MLKLKLKLIYDRQSASALVSGTHLRPATNFSFFLKFSLDSCGFVILWRPLWQEDGSVIYCTIVSGPCQSSYSWVEVTQNSRRYFTVSFETPPTWSVKSSQVTLQLTVSQSVSQYVLVSSPIWDFWPEIFFFVFFAWKLQSCLIWGALSDERSGLSFVSLLWFYSVVVSVCTYNLHSVLHTVHN
jgi:hypothetical protein